MDTMPFGKYQGEPLDELPDAYLEWLCTIELRQPLLGAVLNEVEARGLELGANAPTPRVKGQEKDKVQKVYRALAIEYHPDRGGTDDIMKGINIFYKKLFK